MRLKEKLGTGEFALLAEMEPPKGTNVAAMVASAMRVKGAVDAFVVPEMSNAVMRMSSLGASMILQNNGLQTVMQVNCRDRNRIALQADLLAANGCGVESVMAVTGEAPSFGDHHQARSVYDIDVVELLDAIRGLQQGKDMAGIDLDGSPEFLVGSTANAGAVGRSNELEIEDMKRKIDAGVDFFITPPLFDISTIEPFVKRIDLSGTCLIPTVLLLKSVGMARYIARNLAHVEIPDALVLRLQKAPDKPLEGVRIAAETLAGLKAAGFSGALISTIGWEHKLPDILESL